MDYRIKRLKGIFATDAVQVVTCAGEKFNASSLVGEFASRALAEAWIADPACAAVWERNKAIDYMTHGELADACRAAGVVVPTTRLERIELLSSLPLA